MREHFLRSKLHQLISSRFEARINCIMVKGGISLHHLLNQPLAHVFWIASCFKATIATLRQIFSYWGNYYHIEATIFILRRLLPHRGNSCYIEATTILAVDAQKTACKLCLLLHHPKANWNVCSFFPFLFVFVLHNFAYFPVKKSHSIIIRL